MDAASVKQKGLASVAKWVLRGAVIERYGDIVKEGKNPYQTQVDLRISPNVRALAMFSLYFCLGLLFLHASRPDYS
ncbi:MAG: hypothetical protein ACLTZT_16655 [Butyricimonas faecalis]